MKVSSRLVDNRIRATNVLVEMSIAEYLHLVAPSSTNNEFQRKRVSSSQTVYSLLKSDIVAGCVIPPIVLALNADHGTLVGDSDEEVVQKIVSSAQNLVILDGLQRTYTITELNSEIEAGLLPQSVRDLPIRVEVYFGVNRLGILYRMLTLNTGQTPMSLRQQVEMLYKDYEDTSIGRVELISEASGRYVAKVNQYSFRDVVEGFNSYLNRDESPIDRAGILENIRSMEKLSRENQDREIFADYVSVLDIFVDRMHYLCGDASIDRVERDDLSGGSAADAAPFGKNVLAIFKKSQAMSGLGAALGRLVDRAVVASLEEAASTASNVHLDDAVEFLETINGGLDKIKTRASKIGTAQWSYFTYFFRELFNPDTDSFLNATSAASSAFRKYEDQTL